MKKANLLLISLLLTGCGILGPSYSGNTTASYLLKADTERLINFQFRAYHDCYPHAIHTEVVAIPKEGFAQEIWTATGCNHTEKFDVRYAADPQGGTFLGVTKFTHKNRETK